MALRRKTEPPRRRSLVGSAMRFQLGAQTWRNMPTADRAWQQEAWFHYDSCPELAYAVDWKGNLASRVTLYVAEIDPATGRPVGPTEDPVMQELGRRVLGGPTHWAQHLKNMVRNLDLVGEVWNVVMASREEGSADDEWFTLSVTELEFSAGKVSFTYPKTNEAINLVDKDLYIRTWERHPRLQLHANAPTRALIPVLREITAASKNIAARLDSRVASNGILKVPTEADFATGDDDPETPSLMESLARTMGASMRDPGTAAAQVPIILQADRENLAAIEHIDLSTELSKEIIDLRSANLERLYVGLNAPPEAIKGIGLTSNFRNSEKISEDTYNVHLLPLLELAADSLTQCWLIPMAVEMGVTDAAQRFMFAVDGTDLIAEPDPLEEATALFDRGAITAKALRQLTSTPEEMAPTDEEARRALAIELIKAAPATLFGPLAEIIGLGEAGQSVTALQVAEIQDTPVPVESGAVPELQASGFQAASLAVTYALERAGNKMLNTQRLKEEFAHIPRHELHVRLRPDPERHGNLLDGAWRHTPVLAQRYDLDRYTQALIAAGAPHTDDNLREWLARRG